MRVGFIGSGSQGGPMARRIVEAGHPTTLWARRAATTEPYADTAAKVAASPADLAAESDLVCQPRYRHRDRRRPGRRRAPRGRCAGERGPARYRRR